MGTWSTKINGNDIFQDIYQSFFDLYNQGESPKDISKKIQEDFSEMFEDYDERNDSLFGLAMAQWETKSLDQKIYDQVKNIIESANDLIKWKELGANNKDVENRQKELEKFLLKISTNKEKPKRRVRPKFEFNQVRLLTIVAPDRKKYFEINENYINGEYENTSSMMTWVFDEVRGGGSVFYFHGKGKFVTASWLDSKTLEIRHDKTIQFSPKNESFFYYGDQGIIKYIAE
ncbi:MAG: hypothetical protein LBH14_06470 [Desulfobulbaceae bacterium]|jgi:polyhydroxyalkanoate synthesis regulator phasin|nr:hypothetical protein [Desulfobulbaceae bacterium]